MLALRGASPPGARDAQATEERTMTAIDVDEGLTREQVLLREEAHRFAEEVLRPASQELDALSPEEVIAPQSRLWDVFRQTYQAGYHLRSFPPELGGAGPTPGGARGGGGGVWWGERRPVG